MYNLTPDHFCGYFVEGVEKPYMIMDKTVDNLFVNEELANKYLTLNYIDNKEEVKNG